MDPFKLPYGNTTVGIEDDGHGVAMLEGLIEPLLALVHQALFELDTLARPALPELLAGRSDSYSIDDDG